MENIFRTMYEGVELLNDCIAHDSRFTSDAIEALEAMEEVINVMYGIKVKCRYNNNFIIHTIIFYKNNEVLAEVRCQILQE